MRNDALGDCSENMYVCVFSIQLHRDTIVNGIITVVDDVISHQFFRKGTLQTTIPNIIFHYNNRTVMLYHQHHILLQENHYTPSRHRHSLTATTTCSTKNHSLHYYSVIFSNAL